MKALFIWLSLAAGTPEFPMVFFIPECNQTLTWEETRVDICFDGEYTLTCEGEVWVEPHYRTAYKRIHFLINQNNYGKYQ